jgi:DNA-binding NarL/FixJ family response regulator
MNPDSPIRVAIVEDLVDVSEMLLEGLNQEADIFCKQKYRNAEDAIQFIPKNPPDVVIMDIGLPRASGIDAIVEISKECPTVQFCVFTIYEDDDRIFRSLQAGAKGYILKTAGIDRIAGCIRELHAGGSPMSPSIARRVLDVLQQTNIKPTQEPLPITSREAELLELLATGLLYKEIASKLTITTGTVKQHIHKIYGKLQVSNRTEAINRFHGRR